VKGRAVHDSSDESQEIVASPRQRSTCSRVLPSQELVRASRRVGQVGGSTSETKAHPWSPFARGSRGTRDRQSGTR